MKEHDLLLKLKSDDYKVLIYGAGMVGSLVFHRLLSNGIPEKRIAFVVSKRENGNSAFLGREIYDIHECKSFFKDVHIIISTLPNAHKGIIHSLHENNYFEFDIVDDVLFSEMEKAYAAEYNLQHPVSNKARDILFMPSDNNSSSGAFLSMVDVNGELNARGITTIVVLPSYGSGEELLQVNKIDYTYILSKDWLVKEGCSEKKDFQGNDNAIESIRKLIRQCKIKLVHNNTTYTYVGAIAAKAENIPVVWHLREYIKDQGYWFKNEEKAFELINSSDAVIVVSDYIGAVYKKLTPGIVHKIYNGIDIEKFYCKNHELMAEEKVKILMPGMIAPWKGQAQLLKAALILKQQNYDRFEIAFVGNENPQYAEELKTFIKENGLEDHVSFYGRSQEMIKWYSWADIVVVCSSAEPFGRVTVEAQLAGCLVIGANTGATIEIIENQKTGYLYEYGNAEDLSLKIKSVFYGKDSACKIAELGREMAVRNFTKKHNVDEIIKVYDQILRV